MNEPKTEDQAHWPSGWEESEMVTLCHMAQLPMSVKLEWLEEAARIVEHLQRGHAQRRAGQALKPEEAPR